MTLTIHLWQSCEESRQLETNCGNYCFKIVKPLLEHATALRQEVASCGQSPTSSTETRLQNIERLLKVQEEKFNNFNRLQEILLASRGALFERIGSKVYYLSKKRRLNWLGAEQKCRDLGGHLISLKSQEELDAVSAKFDIPNEFWIDIWDPNNNNNYLSVTTGLKPSFGNWVPGEPNNYNNGEHCVNLKPHSSKYLMNDLNCNVEIHFVCEFDDL